MTWEVRKSGEDIHKIKTNLSREHLISLRLQHNVEGMLGNLLAYVRHTVELWEMNY